MDSATFGELSRVFRCPSNLFLTWLYAGGSRVWQLTFAAAACSAPAPSIDPDGIDAGSGDNAVSRHSGKVVIKPGNHRHKAGWGSMLTHRIGGQGDVVVSLLGDDEIGDLGLQQEASLSEEMGLTFVS